jgi:hypothetical protein
MPRWTLQFLVICPPEGFIEWPEPLAACISQGRGAVDIVETIHEAAVHLVGKPAGHYRAILLEPGTMRPGQIPLLDTLARHKPLWMWLLPSAVRIDPTLREALEKRAWKWQEAASQLRLLLQDGSTRDSREGSSEIPILARQADVPLLPGHSGGRAGDAVPEGEKLTAGSPGGYDGATVPHLSAGELRVLLGEAELQPAP